MLCTEWCAWHLLDQAAEAGDECIKQEMDHGQLAVQKPGRVICKITNEPGRLACLCAVTWIRLVSKTWFRSSGWLRSPVCVGCFQGCKTDLGGRASLQAQSSWVNGRTRETWEDISQACHCKTFTNHLNYGPHYSEPAFVQEGYLSSREEAGERQSSDFSQFLSLIFFLQLSRGKKGFEKLVTSSQLEVRELRWAQSPLGQAKCK